jgi:GTP-binding protein Era
VTRAGFVALAGRPNVGKSTIVNAIVGAKVAIVSDKPQTTRRAIRGVATRGNAQLVLTDLPGVQKPLDALTSRMQRRVEQEFGETDVALFVLNGEQGIGGPGDKWIAEALRAISSPVVVVVNKADRLDQGKMVRSLQAAADLGVGDDIFPVSARTGTGMQPLVDHLIGLLPESSFLFPVEDRSDLAFEVHLAELIREQVLRRTFQEVPHAVEVVVDDVDVDREDLAVVHARAWVETESQKGILIGSGGKMIKAIGTAARRELERDLGRKVHLDLAVRVRRGWRADEALLDRLGID